jgi:outer membrane protein TolC
MVATEGKMSSLSYLGRGLAVGTAAIMLGGCATFSSDGGFDAVETAARDRLAKSVRWTKTAHEALQASAEVERLLGKSLSADDAAQIALLNNRGLQATYAELGIAEAELVQAGRLTNPHFSYLRTSHEGERKLEWTLTFPIIDLITMPLRTRMEARRFEQVKLAIAGATVALALDTRKAWYDAVAADETVRYMQQVKESAETGAELARRMATIGNVPKLTQMREQVFYAEVIARLARARQAAMSQRERLARLMGLPGSAVYKLPERLPDLPPVPADPGDIAGVLAERRYDVLSAKRATESVAASLGLSKVTRFVSALEFGPARTREDPETWKRGFEVNVQIPLFDWGTARVAKAEALYTQAAQRLAQTVINAESETRETYAAYRTAYDTAKHYRDEIVPLRKKISDETLLRYNGMLIGVFELLADAREQVAAVSAAIEAQRDYWIAETELQAAINGAPGAPRTESRNASARAPSSASAAAH